MCGMSATMAQRVSSRTKKKTPHTNRRQFVSIRSAYIEKCCEHTEQPLYFSDYVVNLSNLMVFEVGIGPLFYLIMTNNLANHHKPYFNNIIFFCSNFVGLLKHFPVKLYTNRLFAVYVQMLFISYYITERFEESHSRLNRKSALYSLSLSLFHIQQLFN